jgi:hypothetical protein
MRKLFLPFLFLLGATSAGAQSGTLTTPVTTPNQTKMVVRSFTAVTGTGANQITVEVSFQDAGSSEQKVVAYSVPDVNVPAATFGGMCTAMITVRSGETGSDARKLAFRVLGYLSDRGYLPPHTLVP